MEYSLIANSGIQMTTFRVSLDMQDKFKMLFREWYDTVNGQWKLELLHEIEADDRLLYYNKKALFNEGYLNDPTIEYDPNEMRKDGLLPLMIDGEMSEGVRGEIYKMSFGDKHNMLSCFENKWLPLPYFLKKTEKRYKFSPMNWARMKLVPRINEGGDKEYDVLLAFDTRTGAQDNEYNEYPVFSDSYSTELTFSLCNNEFLLMDYCSPSDTWSYINDYIFKIAHPNVKGIAQLRGANVRKMAYIASYICLVNYFAQNNLFPTVKLYKDENVEVRNVDMVIDIGNSKTTAVLIEDNSNFNQVKTLSLVDYTDILEDRDEYSKILAYDEPFDMRLAFRKVDFGTIGIKDSKQFVYPSFIRLGNEANKLIHMACTGDYDQENLSTYSSPKRYLWDTRPNKEEWEFLVLPGEQNDHILYLNGITEQLMSDGRVDITGCDGGRSYRYSRKSLMTFAFMEMLVQATSQINCEAYRQDNGWKKVPRRVSRIIVTCPTAMSKVERENLMKCAKDAVTIVNKFRYGDRKAPNIQVVPAVVNKNDDGGSWYYDEATCAQLVYIYGEVGHKYKGVSSEFFNLYGKENESGKKTLTVGSLDIGAGTSDLMISEYSYTDGIVSTITPDPLFYDSFYFAGDEILKALIKNVMLHGDKHSAFRKQLPLLEPEYKQKIKNYFGQDYAGQTISERIARRDFNIQYSIPLMCHYLGLACSGSKNCTVKYDDVFGNCPPNDAIIEDFKTRMGIDITKLNWEYDKDFVADIITSELEPLLKKIAAMFYAYSCDIILLSGRPSSLPMVRNIFLKYYPIAPNRLITLNNYYVGDWYPFDQNTGYITNPKTIVVMGGVIGHYASASPNLGTFSMDLSKLNSNLKSTINYVEVSRAGQKSEFLITPEQSRGEMVIYKLPDCLKVKQFGLESYPSRALYSIDYNRTKLASKIMNRALANGETPSDAAIQSLVNEEIETLRNKMPYTITVERDVEDKENLYISMVEDKDGNELSDSCLEIHIQSLGVDDRYWLDSGAFNF